jgi:hypothetical protein
MSFVKDNKAFEKWLAGHCDVVREDIEYKHEQMETSAFVFLRATYFRWARKIGDWCPKLMDSPEVLAVGDLHLENFGTWRDADGRLVWGVNDFDEAATMPCVLDLVRLVTSIRLASEGRRSVSDKAAAVAVLRGYRHGLKDPQAALLFEGETWLRRYAEPPEGKPEEFWKEVKKYKKPPKGEPPREVAQALIHSLPEDVDGKIKMRRRRAGTGSLGRPRYVAIGYWRGGQVLREAKALVPSAWLWAHGSTTTKSEFLAMSKGEYRAPDPFLEVRGKFVIRRIGADSKKIELGKGAGAKLYLRLLEAMGFDLASVHAASGDVKKIKHDLNRRPRGWLNRAARTAAGATKRDFREWKRYRRKHR